MNIRRNKSGLGSLKRKAMLLLGAGGALAFSQAAFAVPTIINSASDFVTLAAGDGDGDPNTYTVNNDLLIQSGGSINFNDPTIGGNNGAGAGTIKIVVHGNMIVNPGGSLGVLAQNQHNDGAGGTINIQTDGNFILGGTTAAANGTVSTSRIGGGPYNAGPVTITAGGNVDIMKTGTISANNNNSGSAGAIKIQATGTLTVDGLVQSQSLLSGTGATQHPGGGAISLIAGDFLTIGNNAKVSSQGQDPGADLVYLQGCGVAIDGLVQSTGVGHATPNSPANNLPAGYTAGVQVVSGHSITIDSTSGHNGEIDANLTGGNSNKTLVDLVAGTNINVIGDTTGPFAIHADNGGNNAMGGQITLKAIAGSLTSTGLAIDASATGSGFPDGGNVDLEAFSNVNLNGSTILARGDFNASGGFGNGGTIFARSFNDDLSWDNGVGDVRPTGVASGLSNPGTITLRYATTVDTTGTSFVTGGTSSLPANANFPNIAQDVSGLGSGPATVDGLVLPDCSNNNGAPPPPAGTPEPLSMTLMAIAGLALGTSALSRRRAVQS